MTLGNVIAAVENGIVRARVRQTVIKVGMRPSSHMTAVETAKSKSPAGRRDFRMLCPSAAELRKFRQGDDLIAEVKILNSTDRNRLVIAEVERVGVRARINADLVYVEE